jgi:hypothetical protein
MPPRGITNITQSKQPQELQKAEHAHKERQKKPANTIIVRQSKSSKQDQKKNPNKRTQKAQEPPR